MGEAHDGLCSKSAYPQAGKHERHPPAASENYSQTLRHDVNSLPQALGKGNTKPAPVESSGTKLARETIPTTAGNGAGEQDIHHAKGSVFVFSSCRCSTPDVNRTSSLLVRIASWAKTTRVLEAALVALFFTSRALLLLTSSAANQNWEEPVFLFGSLELQREGLWRVWDYQDDLDHGGSVPLLLLGALWLRWWEPSVAALKWLVLGWWTVTFVAYLWVVASVFSRRALAVGAVLWLGASPHFARLQVTLVGSHPEAVLPALCATGMLVRLENEKREKPLLWFSTAWLATVAAWMSYALGGWSLAIVCALTWGRWRSRSIAAALLGLLVGALPWIYQNLYRRPTGWHLWIERLFPLSAAPGGSTPTRPWGTLSYLAQAWGAGEAGLWIVTVLAAFAVVPVLALASAGRMALPVRAPRVVWALIAAALLSGLSLALTRISPLPNEDYYFARFFTPLQVLLFILAAGGVDLIAQAWGKWWAIIVATAGVALGGYQLATLYGQGTSTSNFRQEWLRGCLVFGNAEYARAVAPERACERLRQMEDPECRERAFSGLGWSLADEYRRRGSFEHVERALACANDPRSRRAICGGMRFVLTRTASIGSKLPQELDRICPP